MRVLLFKLAGLLILVLSLTGAWFILGYKQFTSTPIDVGSKPMDFVIKSGWGLNKIANELLHQGIVSDADYFALMAYLSDQGNEVHKGEYTLHPGMRPMEVLTLFVKGQVKQYSFTIIEGWTFKQLLTELKNAPKLQQELKGLDTPSIMRKLGYPDLHPEGRFLPDTYFYPLGNSDLDFLKRAYVAMEKALATEWKNRAPKLPYKTAYEALIMASIVEKETGDVSERNAIAGVFVRRLNQKMRLQTDPTVIYGMGDNYKGNIRKKDLKNDTPYNTYRRHGLPPTPIAMPGIEAIRAALHPDDGNTLYFVAKGDGSHQFSTTIEGHNKAVRKYQITHRKKDYRTSPAEVK